MKAGIHPTYNEKVTAQCSCGNTFETGSTSKELSVEICSACHPFYTGKSKMVDTAGRVDRFQKRLKDTEKKQKAAASHRTKKGKKGKSADENVVKIG